MKTRVLIATFASTLFTASFAAEVPPWNDGATLGDKMLLEKTTVCTDGKGHYVVRAPDEQQSHRLYWGDEKALARVAPPPKLISGHWFLEPRAYNKGNSENFRGVDLRVYSRVEVKDAEGARSCAVTCGERTVKLSVLAPEKATPLLLSAKYEEPRLKTVPLALLRDDDGTYYVVDQGNTADTERHLRLFVGKKGALKEVKITETVAEQSGYILATAAGSLRFGQVTSATWTLNKKSKALRDLPVNDNLAMIYKELGVYASKSLGNPCDAL